MNAGRPERRLPFLRRSGVAFGPAVLRGVLAALLVAAGGPAASSGSRPSPDSLRGTVTFVYDGDTIRVRLSSGQDRKVRLIGVDTPEMDDAREEVRFLAFAARRFAVSRLTRRPVQLALDREKEDAFGRLLAYVRTETGELFNEVLIAEGYGFALLKYPFDDTVKQRLQEAERSARLAGKGLWRREAYPEIGPGGAAEWVGRMASVRFRCVRAFERGRFLVLRPSEDGFEAVIPRAVLAAIPGARDLAGKTMVVTGFVEVYDGVPQIMIGVPLQIKTV